MSKPKPKPTSTSTPTIKELMAHLVKHFPDDYSSIEHHYTAYTYPEPIEPKRVIKEEYTLYIGNHNHLNQYSIPSYDLLVAYVMYAVSTVCQLQEDTDNGN